VFARQSRPNWLPAPVTLEETSMNVFHPEDLERLLHEYRRGRLSRRLFVQALGSGGVVLAGSALAAACGPTPPPAAPAEKANPAGAAPTAASKPAAQATTASAAPAAVAQPTAAQSGAAQPAASAGGNDSVVLVFGSDVGSMDPHNHALREGIKLFYHLFDNLGVRDYSNNKVKPWLATDWKATSDTTWEMDLRTDVKFHNGDPFTAETVKANIERMINPENKLPQRGNWESVESVEIVSPSKIIWHTKKPYPVFVERLQNLQFVSEKVLKEKGPQFLAETPIGTGPYKFVKWDRGQEIVLERNDDYWGPKPAFKHASIRIIKDPATAVAELLAGRVDIVPAFPIDQMKTLESSGAGYTSKSDILRTCFLVLDTQGRTGPNPFQDKNVRIAANHALDVDGYIKKLQAGGQKTPGNVSNLAFGFDATIQPYPYDVEKAKAALGQAGYKMGSDGTMEKDGQKLEVRFMTGTSTVPNVKQVTEAMVQDFQAAGIKATIQNIPDATTRVGMMTDGKGGPMYWNDWGYFSVFDADGILWDMFHSSSPYSYFKSPDLDTLLEDARGTIDEAKRKDAYAKAQKLLHDEAAVVFLWAATSVWGVSKRTDWQGRADEIDRMFEAKPKG
jgi:peptide/nickel transport system substrate-binding protein